MIGLLARFRLLPSGVHVALVAGLVILGWQVKHRLEVRELRKDIVRTEAARDAAIAAQVTLRVQVLELAANRDQLAAEIRVQNAAVEALRQRAESAARAADTAALRALQAGERTRTALLAEASVVRPGVEEMNLWFASTFAP